METVLVVEDSLTQRQMISQLLRSSGLNVTAASDGVEALKQVQLSCPEIVVLDIVLPRMNGYEVCRRLKSDEKTQKPAIVICSFKSERFDLYWALKQGADAYISKPFRPQELVETVKYLLPG
jgi:twitching motility two-component system response regulator PilH